MLVLGIDPGFRHFGFCLVRLNGQPEVINKGTLDIGSTKDWRDIGLGEIHSLFGRMDPDLIAIEELVWHGVRRGVLALAHLAGAVAGYWLAHDKDVVFFPPKDVKQATRVGRFPRDFTEHEKDALSLCRLALDLHSYRIERFPNAEKLAAAKTAPAPAPTPKRKRR